MKANVLVVVLVQCAISYCTSLYGSSNFPDLADYRKTFNKTMTMGVKNSGFESGKNGWTLRKGFKIVKGQGRNATAALYLSRVDPLEISYTSRKFKLTPGDTYKFGCWVKAKINRRGKYRVGASFYLKFMKGKKVLSYIYQKGLCESGNWKYIERSFTMPAEADSCILNLCMHNGYTGEAWFDDISLVREDQYLVYAVTPGNRVLFTDNPVMKAAAWRTGGVIGKEVICAARFNSSKHKQKILAKRKNGIFELDFKKLPAGQADMELLLLDTKNKKILARENFKVNVLTPADRARKNTCWIDNKGRTVVNGKLFLPVGVFTGYVTREDIDLLAASGINCIAPYASLYLRFNHKSDKTNSIKKLTQVLDYSNSKKVKVIFSLQNVFNDKRKYSVKKWYGAIGADNVIKKVINTFKNHPAILCWYVNDERPASMFKQLYARRALVNTLDPYHPAWTVSMHFTELYSFAPTCDVLGIDPYPINKKAQNMYIVNFAARQARKVKMPYWGVPQIYNMAFYSNRKNIKNWTEVHRDPSEEEIRSMVLAMAQQGAKGFVFYHYNCIMDRDGLIPIKGYFEQNWPKIKNVTSMLKKLKPFLLSDNDCVSLACKSVVGKVTTARFIANDSRACIVITGEGPGKSECIISDHRNFKSLFGKTVKLQNGKYQFKGNNICSDVLLEEK